MVLAIVSGNDYAENIYGVGIATNLKFLQAIHKTGPSQSVMDLIHEYGLVVEEDVKKLFAPAIQIFLHLEEKIIDRKSELPGRYQKLIDTYNRINEQYDLWRQTKRDAKYVQPGG